MTRLLTPSVLALALAACAADPGAADGLEAQVEARLLHDPSAPGAWIGVETLTVVGVDGAVVCADEVEVVAADLEPCEDCSLTVEVTSDRDAPRCALADGDTVDRAGDRVLGFFATSGVGRALTGWIDAAADPSGPWESFAEGMLDPEAFSWHHEMVLEHTSAADLEGGPQPSTSGGPPSR